MNFNKESVQDIHNETNKKLYDRNVPSQMLQPYLDVRPVATKYSHFPIVDPRKETHVQLNQTPTFSPHTVFQPGNTKSPWSGFVANVNKESELRNQIYALQKCSQAVYVPQSTSDLYTYAYNPKQTSQTHQLLFQENTFCEFDPNPDKEKVGTFLFMNPTRAQIKESTTNL
jgi:hypothetical protein